jgi:hypothetical protein
VVLYEMLTGARAFEGEDVAQTLVRSSFVPATKASVDSMASIAPIFAMLASS